MTNNKKKQVGAEGAAPETETLPGGVTAEQINEWKEKHGQVFQLDIPLDDEGNTVTGYARKPDLKVLAAAQKLGDDSIKQGGVLFDNCFLGGDPEVRENEECRFSAFLAIGNLFRIRAAEVKNL